MKKFLAFILALACALSLMACGKKNNDDKPDPVSYTHLDVYKRQGLWYAGLALAIVGGVIGQRIGVKKGRALDDIYREVAWELKHEAEAEAAREAAAHTLTSGAEELPETDEQNETTEDKGETEDVYKRQPPGRCRRRGTSCPDRCRRRAAGCR